MADTVEIKSHGITCEIDRSCMADQRFMHSLSKVSDERVADGEKLVWYSRMLDLLFDGGAYDVMCELADANGGTCDMDTFNAFFSDVMEQAQAKNS